MATKTIRQAQQSGSIFCTYKPHGVPKGNDQFRFIKVLVNIRQGTRLIDIVIVVVASFELRISGMHIVQILYKIGWFVEVELVIFLDRAVKLLVSREEQFECLIS